MKLDCIILRTINDNYQIKQSTSELLLTVYSMLRESKNFRLNIKQLILNKCTIGRLAANSTLVTFDEEEKIYIKPLYGDDSEEFCVGLTRENLLKLINDWEELLKKRPEEIILTRDENGNITVQEHTK